MFLFETFLNAGFFFFFETRSPVAQAALKLSLQLKVTLNS